MRTDDADAVHEVLELLLVLAAALEEESEVDGAQEEAGGAEGDPEEAAEDEGEDAGDAPEDGGEQTAAPEDLLVEGVELGGGLAGVEDPLLIAGLVVDAHPPGHAHQFAAGDVLDGPEVDRGAEQHEGEVHDGVGGQREEAAWGQAYSRMGSVLVRRASRMKCKSNFISSMF